VTTETHGAEVRIEVRVVAEQAELQKGRAEQPDRAPRAAAVQGARGAEVIGVDDGTAEV
jgi:hypothetical protein